MAKKWLDKYNDGGPVQENYNDASVSTGPDFVGLGYDTTGRNYSPAWGGQFQDGGFLQPTSSKLPEGYVIPYNTPSTELAMSIGGEKGEPAYLIPSFKGGKKLKDPIAEFKKTGEHLGGPFKTWQEAEKFGEMRHQYVEKGQDIPTPLKTWGDMAMGGNIPGSVGFTYARTNSPAPSNGPYAKKTLASAQNGKEMKFYQEGLDWTPKNISKNGSVIKDDRGQWAHPGEVTEIGSNEITMHGVDYPVLGISDTGDTKMMYPDQDYKFDGESVTEYPMAQDGENISGNLKKQAEEFLARRNNPNNRPNISQYTPKKGEAEISDREKLQRIKDEGKFLNKFAKSKAAGNLEDAMMFAADVMTLGEAAALTKPALKAAAKYATEKTALKNAYKLNPYAFKPTEGMMYRGLGKEGMEDALASGVFRAKQDVQPMMLGRFDVSKQFSKAYYSPQFDIADQYGQGFIAEVPRAASDWGKRYGRKQWSQIAQRDIPVNEGKILKKDWLKGYKEVKQPALKSNKSINNSLTPIENLESPKLSIAEGNVLKNELIKNNQVSKSEIDAMFKREKDWLNSDEYLKRRMSTTGETKEKVKADVDKIVERIGKTRVQVNKLKDKKLFGYYAADGDNKGGVVVASEDLNRDLGLSTFDHEIKHAMSQASSAKPNYKNYPTIKVGNWFQRNIEGIGETANQIKYLNEPAEQQVRGLKLLDLIEKSEGIPRGTALTQENITSFLNKQKAGTEAGKRFENVNSDVYELLQEVAYKYKKDTKRSAGKRLLDFLNKVYIAPGAAVVGGAGAMGGGASNNKKQNGGWLNKYK